LHYLDNAATTKPGREAVAAATDCLTADFGNPSSLHGVGRRARESLEQARARVAAALGVSPAELGRTGGGTEACNLALLGAAGPLRRRGGHLIASTLEHPAVAETMKALKEDGFALTLVPPGPEGRVRPEAVTAALREDTVLVSVMLVCNETGAVNPVADIARAVKAQNPRALVHTDGVQGLFKVSCAPRALGVDLLSVSAHKVGGLKGAGALWRAPGARLTAVSRGGGQEGGLRSGTEAMPALAAFGAACAARSAAFAGDTARMEGLKARLLSGLAALPTARVIPPHDAPHIVALSLPGYPGEVMARFLSDRGVYVSTGSACHRGRRSEALISMGLPPRTLDGVLRVSLCPDNAPEDIDALLAGLAAGLETLAHN
jgi:cysteine desulfurase